MHLSHHRALALVLLTSLVPLLPARASDWPQWRGPHRNSISTETGLLQQWPQQGPPLRWRIETVGIGYAAPTIVGDRLYVLGSEGVTNEFVQALRVADGSLLWKTRLGNVGQPDQKPNFPCARSTPTADDSSLFALGSDGDLVCLNSTDGTLRWSQNLRTDFGGKPGAWAYAESPLVDGDLVICTPGGGEATIVALRKTTGAVVWKAALPEADEAGYASAIVVETGGIRQYVQLLQKGLVGLDAKTGKLLWRYAKAVSRFNANIPSPLADGDLVYVAAAGTGGGAVRLQSHDGTVTADPVYFEAKLPTAIGGAVKVGDLLFGTTAQALLCVEWASGQVKWEERAIGAASLCVADGRLYLHGENGEVALVEPSVAGYREQGRFTPPNPPKHAQEMEKAWAYPVLANGHLYLRDREVLWCYDVRSKR